MNSDNKLLCWRDVVSVFRPTGLLFGQFQETAKEIKSRPRLRRVAYWLILSVALISSFAGGYYLVKYSAGQIIDPDQLRSAAEGGPNQSPVTFAQAVQALRVRH
jgi:hypothetical protein